MVVGLAACGSTSQLESTTSLAGMTTNPMPDTTDPATNGFELKVGVNSGPDTVAEFAKGDNVVITVVNNSGDDEVHVHGYDLTTGNLPKGQSATLAFTADKVGDFEVESHVTEEVLMIIRVTDK
jgi:FtsP/CotA-like multicopper oxidase with cupredoxin domain